MIVDVISVDLSLRSLLVVLTLFPSNSCIQKKEKGLRVYD